MLDGAANPIRGRCPTCSQLVTLPSEARAQTVECPSCRQQALGRVFNDLETPLAVIAVSRSAPPSARRSSEAAVFDLDIQGVATPKSVAPDEARTHLMLGPVDRAGAGGRSATASSRAALPPKSVAPDEARTQLIVGPIDRAGGGVRHSAAPASKPAASTPVAATSSAATSSAAVTNAGAPARVKRGSEEERTHLLLDPLDLKEEQETALSRTVDRLGGVARPVLRLSLRLDELLRGRRRALLTVLAVACGVVPPVLDYLLDDPASTVSVFASFAALFVLAAFALAALIELRTDDGRWDLAVLPIRVQTAFRRLGEDLQEYGRSPRYLKLLLSGELVAVLGAITLAWVSSRSVVRLLLDLPDPASVLRLLAGAVLLLGVLLVRRALSLAPAAAPGPQDLAECAAAATQLAPIIDLCEPLPPSFVGEDTRLHRVLFALSEWRAPAWPDEASYRAALERHLQRHLPNSRIERDRRNGPTPSAAHAHLIVDDLVLVEVKHGFRKPSAERAIAQMSAHALTWPGKPMVLAIFEAPRETIFESTATPALLELHERLPLVTARMRARG
jgi:hypothetical protein